MANFEKEFARNGAKFTVDLFENLATNGAKQNIFFSPFSVQCCMALAFAGAQGETAEEMVQGLKLVSSIPSEVATSFQYVLEQYKNNELLKIANKVYVQEGHALKTEYETNVKENYLAESEPIDFAANQAAADAVNKWVSERTAGKITKLISADSLGPLTRLVLLNAMHFKGKWANMFDKENTQEDDFWVGEEESVKLAFMNKKAKFNYGYFEELQCSAIEMPYQDSDLSMLVLLPFERSGIKSLAEKLKNTDLTELASQMKNQEVVVKFPAFKTEYTIELNAILKKLGIQKIFGAGAELNNMLKSSADLYVSNVIHKAAIEVNEEGTEAAAATRIILMMGGLISTTEFVADHPFLYMIWNKKNILFAGSFVSGSST